MSKTQQNFYTAEIDPAQNDKMTLAIEMALVYSDEYGSNKVFDRKASKIKLDLNNFSGGKGEDAKHYYFNLTIAQFRQVYRAYNNGSIKDKKKFYYTTSYDAYPVKDETDKHCGLHEVRSLTIEFISTMNNPYKIEILNGYAPEGKQKAEIDVRTEKRFFDDLAFGKILDDINDAIDVAKTEYALSGILEKGRTGLANQKEEFKTKAKNSAPKNSNTPVQQQATSVPQNVQPQQIAPVQQSNQQAEKEIHAVRGKFTSTFFKLEKADAFIVDFTVQKKIYKIYFKNVPDELRTAQEIGNEVTINIYQYGDKLIFDSMIQ